MPEDGHSLPRFSGIVQGLPQVVVWSCLVGGLIDCILPQPDGISPDVIALIASIAAPSIDVEPWIKTAKIVEEKGADLIEINSASPCSGAELQQVLAVA